MFGLTFFSADDRRLLFRIAATLESLNLRIDRMSEVIDTLAERVAKIETIGDSTIALVNGLSAELKAAIAANDPAAIQALSDRLEAQAGEFADAILANTSAAQLPDEPTV